MVEKCFGHCDGIFAQPLSRRLEDSRLPVPPLSFQRVADWKSPMIDNESNIIQKHVLENIAQRISSSDVLNSLQKYRAFSQ